MNNPKGFPCRISGQMEQYPCHHATCQKTGRMKRPRTVFLVEMAKALSTAEHKNVAGRCASGMLWAMFPEWFDKEYILGLEKRLNKLREEDGKNGGAR